MSQRDLFTAAESPPVLSVWELTSQIKDLLEVSFPTVWVVGEISNLSRPQSGHCYLTLKDDRAQSARPYGGTPPRACDSSCATDSK